MFGNFDQFDSFINYSSNESNHNQVMKDHGRSFVDETLNLSELILKHDSE